LFGEQGGDAIDGFDELRARQTSIVFDQRGMLRIARGDEPGNIGDAFGERGEKCRDVDSGRAVRRVLDWIQRFLLCRLSRRERLLHAIARNAFRTIVP
jgi:hypothetical protein